MLKIVGIIFTLLVTSCFFFPFNPSFMPIINTKMVVAAIGLMVLIVNKAKGSDKSINHSVLELTFYAGLVSLISFMSVVFHGTIDYSYVGFIMSFFVWTGAAYACLQLMKLTHGHISVRIVCGYLIAVCVCQCILALSMDFIPILKNQVDSLIGSIGFMGKTESRLYGIGCANDVAGSRFAAILIMIAYLTANRREQDKEYIFPCYLIAFAIIVVIGNMISRTTLIGIIIAVLYWLYTAGIFGRISSASNRTILYWIMGMLAVAIPVTVYYYNTNIVFHENLRFGFEGFFNWVEKGHWETTSNNILKNMIIFPDNLGTWLFGDGYMLNPYDVDPYYVGENYQGFYKETDIGYLRFIFYFGVVGLIAIIAYMIKVSQCCMRNLPKYRMLFGMLLLFNFIFWTKVSSDIFLVFAPFLLITQEEDDDIDSVISYADEE